VSANLVITRIDFTVVPVDGAVNIRKYAEGWTASTLPAIASTNRTQSLEDMLAWLEDHGWTIRRWPGGARAFRDRPMPVRTRAAIQRLRHELTTYPIPGVELHTLDFALDW
jgi:hypothetical protein